MPNTLPFGTQFSPNQIELPRLLQLAVENEGDETAPLIDAIATAFFGNNAAGHVLFDSSHLLYTRWQIIKCKTYKKGF